jgi:hypothetical protein
MRHLKLTRVVLVNVELVRFFFKSVFGFCFLRLFKFISGSEYNHRSGVV